MPGKPAPQKPPASTAALRPAIMAAVLFIAWPGTVAAGQSAAATSSAGAQVTGAALAPRVRATTADFAWVAGRWRGETAGNAGQAEVVFGPPAAGVITGVMRLVMDGKVVVVELVTLVDTPDGLQLRFRHFSPELTAYETDYRQNLRLKEFRPDRAVFENLVPYESGVMSTQPRSTSFVRTGADSYVAHSDIIGSDDRPATIEVSYHRMAD